MLKFWVVLFVVYAKIKIKYTQHFRDGNIEEFLSLLQQEAHHFSSSLNYPYLFYAICSILT